MARLTKEEKARRERLRALAGVANEIEGFGPGREVLTEVRSVPTIFPQFDVATRVEGFPLQRIMLVHGPSNEGKTFFSLGAGLSFLRQEHFFFHIDAEFTTPQQWVVENLREAADFPTFRALRPKNYEEVADTVRRACERIHTSREKGAIPEHTSALFVVDSLQKLVPSDFLKKWNDKKETGVDPMKGRGGQVQAMFNAAWMKEVVPLMYHCNAALLLISRETDNVDAGMFEKKYRVTGGKATYYDSSLVCRVTRNAWHKVGSGDNERVIGERHLIQIVKTKVGHKSDKTTRCYFNTSNGGWIPPGFDTARDVLELALESGVVIKEKGAKLTDTETGEVYGVMNQAVKALTGDLRSLEDLRARAVARAVPMEDEEAESEQ